VRLLLDTCSFLWALQDPRRLSAPARQALERSENEVFVSVVSFWEISLKTALGKLSLRGGAPEDMPRFAEESSFTILSLDAATAATVGLASPAKTSRSI
jgi:PIN domain nuclease of toxin-antitoxin system